MVISGSLGAVEIPESDGAYGAGAVHPLEAMFPRLRTMDGIDQSAWMPDAEPVFVHPDLRAAPNGGANGVDPLHIRLARVVTRNESTEADGMRFVEPGVGRTFLVDGIAIADEPQRHDFSCSGVGLTCYARGGFADVGRDLDGMVSLKRALHRKRTARRLEAIGCRAPTVVAIYQLPARMVRMLDGTVSPAVVMVRAFRSIARVKQLDPIAGFFHGARSGAIVASALVETVARRATRLASPIEAMHHLATAVTRSYAAADDLARLLALIEPLPAPACPVRQLRLDAIRAYAPQLLRLIAVREGVAAAGSGFRRAMASHAAWFCRALGAQLRRMRDARFLHDYHHEGVRRHAAGWLYTLVENNVTLACEFADLETGLFVDDDISALCDALQLTPEDVSLLRRSYDAHHRTDLEMARRIAECVVAIGKLCDALTRDTGEACLDEFTRGYLSSSYAEGAHSCPS